MAMAPVALTTLCTPRSGRWTAPSRVTVPSSVRRSTAKENEPSWDSRSTARTSAPAASPYVVAPYRAARSAHTASSAHSTFGPSMRAT